MALIETKSGFSVDVSESSVDDMEFLDLICDLEDGKPRAHRALCVKLLGEEGCKRLYEHVRTEDGRVPISAIDREIAEVINGLKDAKK